MKKNETLHSMLTHLAQDATLPKKINLWPSIQTRLAAGNDRSQHGEYPMQTNPVRKPAFRAALAGALTILLAVALLLGLPQSRAWAQNLWRFFANTSDQIVLPTQPAVRLAQPGTAPTSTPFPSWRPQFYAFCGDIVAPRCSIAQIQAMVDFPVKGIADLPEGMQFLGATGGTEGIYLSYRGKDPAVNLLLLQGPSQPDDQPMPVGASAVVESVQIGAVSGEYVQGAFFHKGGDPISQWQTNASTQSLRWDAEGIRYTLWMSASPDSSQGALDQASLVRLAGSLNGELALLPTPPVVEAPKTAAQVAQEAGFSLLEPAWLPQDFWLDRAIYLPETKRVCLLYGHLSDVVLYNALNRPAPSLSIVISVEPLPEVATLIVDGLRPDQILLEQAALTIRGAKLEQGQFTYGSIKTGRLCEIESLQNQLLTFQTDDRHVAIIAQAEGPMGGEKNWLTRQEMVQIAESMTGTQIVAQNQPDPEHLTSLAEAEQLAGFPLKQPALLPEGMAFTYAQVEQNGSVTEAVLHYSDGNQEISVRQVKGSQETVEGLAKDYPEAYQPVTVNGQPALLSQGFVNENGWKALPNGGDGAASLIWLEHGILYSVGGFNAYPTQVWLEIAESVK
jgi:hypothetical protein